MTDQHSYHVWHDSERAAKYLEGIRGGVPFAAAQIDLLLRIVRATGVRVARVLDIGCGDGILGRALLERFPESHGTFLDLSPTMVAAAGELLRPFAERAAVVQGDFGQPGWVDLVRHAGPFDVVVSGFAIHHQTDERKRALYAEIHELLAPGGMLLNMEHVASCSPWAEQAFNDLLIDSLWAYHQNRGSTCTREEVAQQYVQRQQWSANILAPLDDQCRWLREIGYVDVECFFKAFELTIFGGRTVG